MTQPPLPTPGQRVSGIDVPEAYALPGQARRRGAAGRAGRLSPDAVRARRTTCGSSPKGWSCSSASCTTRRTRGTGRTSTAPSSSTWSRAYMAMADACLLRDARFVRVRAEPRAIGVRADRGGVPARSTRRWASTSAWLLGHLKPDEEHKAFDIGLGHYFAGTTLAADEGLRSVYRAASDLGRPNFGATLLETGPESNNARLAYSFADASFHVAWAEIELGWLLRLAERQVAVAVHMPEVLNITPETHAAYADFSAPRAAGAVTTRAGLDRGSGAGRLQAMARAQLPAAAFGRAEEDAVVVASWPAYYVMPPRRWDHGPGTRARRTGRPRATAGT